MPGRCAPLVCAALTLYGTSPYAQSLPANAPLALKLSLQIASEVDLPTLADERKAPAVDVGAAQPAFVGIRVNRQEHGTARLLRLPDTRWLARRADIEAWRLRLPDAQPVLFAGEEHFALDVFEGIAYRFDAPRQE